MTRTLTSLAALAALAVLVWPRRKPDPYTHSSFKYDEDSDTFEWCGARLDSGGTYFLNDALATRKAWEANWNSYAQEHPSREAGT